MENSISIKIGGQAGYGIMATGLMLGKTCARGGLNVCAEIQYPSLIRGGHNTYLLRASKDEIFSFNKEVNLLVALNKETIELHKNELISGAVIIYDSDSVKYSKNELKRKDITLVSVPLVHLATKHGGEIMKNTVSLGAVVGLTDYDFALLESVIRDVFSDKKREIITNNISAAKAGYDYIKKNFKGKFDYKLKKIKSAPKMFISGNEAIAIGAIKAGCKFYTAYPMTPSSSILHYMASKEREYNLVVRQVEDELAAMNMVVGASHVGVRALVATSGGGFCLMTEALGLAAMSETPVVVINGQRGGPSTGLATWTEQADLKFVINASHGDFVKIVIAPGNQTECFYKVAEAFNLAEKYQVPVIVLTDKQIAEIPNTCDVFDQSKIRIERGKILNANQIKKIGAKDFFKRYVYTRNGISPRVLPGTKGGMFVANSNEHDEYGNLAEDEETRVKMMDKRRAKIKDILKDLPKPKIYGPTNADITIIGWGSTKRSIMESILMLNKEKINANYLQIVYMKPFHSDEIAKIIKSSKITLLVENNQSNQLGNVIKENTGLDVNFKLKKYSGRAFYPEEIVAKVKEVIKIGKHK